MESNFTYNSDHEHSPNGETSGTMLLLGLLLGCLVSFAHAGTQQRTVANRRLFG